MSRNLPHTEDTAPLSPSGQAAQPVLATGRHWLLERGRWLLSLLVVFTSCTLILTLMLFVRAIPAASVVDSGRVIGVSIHYRDSLRQVTTSAETVGDLLKEQGIEMPLNANLSPAASERVIDGMVVTVSLNREVSIVEDGIERDVNTTHENPLDILQEAGITLSEADKIWVNGALAYLASLPEWTVPARLIEIRRAASVAIIDDGEQSSIVTTADTVGDALFEAGITLYMTDEVTPSLDSPITSTLTISIKRAIPVVLQVDGVAIDARTNAERVADVLTELNAPLFGLDYVNPPGESAVNEGMQIEIVRVTEEIVAESETISHSVQYRPDANLNLDERAVVQQGRDGSREIRSLVRYENGIEVSRVHSETIVIEPAVNRIIAYGTNAVPLGTVQTPNGPRQYWRRLCVYVTSYNPTSNGGNLRTSTGASLAKGIIAAKPNIIPYYTELYVPDYGLGIVRDTGGGPSGTDYWIDLGYSDHNYERWRKYTYVYLLGAPPDKAPTRLPAWTPNSNWPGNCS